MTTLEAAGVALRSDGSESGDERSSVAFVIDKNTMCDNIFAGVHAMLRMTGESACVFVLSNAIGLSVFHTHLGSLDKVPFVNHCRTKTGSAEGLD